MSIFDSEYADHFFRMVKIAQESQGLTGQAHTLPLSSSISFFDDRSCTGTTSPQSLLRPDPHHPLIVPIWLPGHHSPIATNPLPSITCLKSFRRRLFEL